MLFPGPTPRAPGSEISPVCCPLQWKQASRVLREEDEALDAPVLSGPESRGTMRKRAYDDSWFSPVNVGCLIHEDEYSSSRTKSRCK